MKKLFFSSIILFGILSCTDSDDTIEKNNRALLPKVITTTQSYDAEPEYVYTHIKTFNYDNLNRLIEIITETYRNMREERDVSFFHSITEKIEYLVDNTISQTDITTTTTETTSVVRIYSMENKSTINIILDENLSETIELENGLAMKYNKQGLTKTYQYNEKGDISQYSYSSRDYSSIKKYETDNREGIFKNMNIPQWFFVYLFEEEGQLNNIEEIYILHNGTFMGYGTNIYEYNNMGYPVKITFMPAREIVGLWGSNSTIEYINAKIPNGN